MRPEPPSPPSPEAGQTAVEAERHAFRCDNCGAELRWDPDADALRCDFCQTARPVPRDEGTVLERPLTAAAAAAAAGLGLNLRLARCEECGARVSFADAATAATCVYCGAAVVLDQEANRQAIRPESLVPLDLGRAAVEEAFRRWVRRLWLRPRALRRARVAEAAGVYVPFWTFDCAVHSDWTADAGYSYWVTERYTVLVNGRPEQRSRRVRRVRWVPVRGKRDDAYDDLLVCASAGLSGDLLERLGPFDTTALVPYRPEYLAGWRAEEYTIDLEAGWQEAQARVEAEQRRRCEGDVPGDTHRDLRVRNRIHEVSWKHVLLPVWSLSYRFRGCTWTVLVNGQTGRVAGEAPYSRWKVFGLLLAVAAASFLFRLVLNQR
ncbi:MAG: primosomal protein N' (replication factor Y) - superfamily II helicase [Planctomycetota bacterium]|nr:MAG: primosomal protein N' (replication factor Y) - superfamily II helicase [Planctomycetota bacterium]